MSLFLAGCGGETKPLYGDLDLGGIRLSPEMAGPLAAARIRLDQPVSQAQPSAGRLAQYYFLSHAINDLDPAAAVDSLLTLWETAPENFLWIDLGLRRASILKADPRYHQILDLPALNDTNSAVGCFRLGRDHYAQESGGRWWGRSLERQQELDPLQRIWLAKMLTMVDRGALRPEDGVRRLVTRLEEASRIGGPRLEFDLWLSIVQCLEAGDHLDDALHAAAMAGAWAVRLGDPYMQTRTEFWLGRVFLARQELAAAGTHFQTARELAQANGFIWQRKASGFRAASVLDALGDYPAVLAADRANLGLMRATADSLNIPRFLINIANTHRQMGQLDSCRVYQEEAVRCVAAYPHPSNVARIPLMIAEYCAQVGQYARMDSLLQVALDNPINSRVAEEAIRLHVNLIRGGLEQGRPDQVHRSIVQVDSLRNLSQVQGGQGKVDYEADLLIAQFYGAEGDYARAAQSLERAAVTLANTESLEARWSLLCAKGALARQRGDLETALTAFQAAHELMAEVDNPDLQARGRFLLGSALLEAGRPEAARDLFPADEGKAQFGGRFRTRLASQLFRGVTFARAGDQAQAARQLQVAVDMCSPWSPTDLVARAHLELGQALAALGQIPEASAHLETAMSRLTALGRGRDEALPEVFHGDLPRDVVEALIALYVTWPETAPGSDPALATLNLWRSLDPGTKHPEGVGRPADWAPGQLVFFVGKKASYCWTLTADGIGIRTLPATDELEGLMLPVLSDLTRPGRALPGAGARQLADVLLTGAEVVWPPGGTLRLVCDGPLGSLPWAALPLPASFAADSGRLAIQRGPLVYQLKPQRTTDRPAASDPGPPDGYLLAVGANTGETDSLSPLAHAEEEAEAIRALWPSDRSRLLLGDHAAWSTLRTLDMTAVQALHVASHARVHRGLPEQSYLVLSGARGPEQLTADAVAHWQLSADLVFLSSCETAAAADGRTVGVFVQAFIDAGARSVIASSLGVDDTASRFLAESVYRHWVSGLTLPEALRRGQLDLGARDATWSHPFYWAFCRIYQ